MRELRLGLRLYLWAMYLACVLLIIGQVGAFVAWRPHEPEIHVALLRVLVFALLAYAGERTTLRVSGAIPAFCRSALVKCRTRPTELSSGGAAETGPVCRIVNAAKTIRLA